MDFIAAYSVVHKFATGVLMLPDYWLLTLPVIFSIWFFYNKLKKSSDKRDNEIMSALHGHDEGNKQDFETMNKRIETIKNDIHAIDKKAEKIDGRLEVLLEWLKKH